MQVNAYAAGMTPDMFWRSTPREVGLMCKGFGRRMEAYQSLAVWHLAPILNMVSKRRITPDMLLGRNEGVMSTHSGRMKHPDPMSAIAALTRAYLESEDRDG